MTTKQYLQREEARIAANYLVHCREKETNDNILARIRQNEKNIDAIEGRLDRKRTESIRRGYEKTSAVKITREFMLHIRKIVELKSKKLDPVHDEEVLRRYSLLTKQNVARCVKLSFATLNNLNAYYSTRGVIHESMLFLLRLVITVRIRVSESIEVDDDIPIPISKQVPNMEMPSSADIRRYNFETASEILNGIKNRHLEMIERALDSQLAFAVKVCERQDRSRSYLIDSMFANSIIQAKTQKQRGFLQTT